MADARAELEAAKKFTGKARGELKLWTCINDAKAPCLTLALFIVAKSIGQLQKDLDAAKESQRYAESQHQAGVQVLKRSHEENNKLKAENQQQVEKLESLKAQLVQALGDNQRFKSGTFSKCYLSIGCKLPSAMLDYNKCDMLDARSPNWSARRRGQ